ncbi:hypothetical protein MRB53_041147 [Persea americana]|nr:hypothetical protein MRB53_041147 [Persea americana]
MITGKFKRQPRSVLDLGPYRLLGGGGSIIGWKAPSPDENRSSNALKASSWRDLQMITPWHRIEALLDFDHPCLRADYHVHDWVCISLDTLDLVAIDDSGQIASSSPVCLFHWSVDNQYKYDELDGSSFVKNLNYRSPSENHPGLGISLRKVHKRNTPPPRSSMPRSSISHMALLQEIHTLIQ